jgi:hypothetical protein
VTGCLLWQGEGLEPPARVEKYTDDYRRESDPLADFFDEMCEFDPKALSTRSAIREAYRRWSFGGEQVSAKELAASVCARGAKDAPGKVHGERGWIGIRLIESSSADRTSDDKLADGGDFAF